MNKEIVITFNKDGTIESEGNGFKGPECDKFMAEFEKALGKETKRVKKPDWNQRGQIQQRAGA